MACGDSKGIVDVGMFGLARVDVDVDVDVDVGGEGAQDGTKVEFGYGSTHCVVR